VTYQGRRVAVLIAAYNEETQIGLVLKSLPDYVDHIVVVDDASTDQTLRVIADAAAADPRVLSIALDENSGVGGALSHAYMWARENHVDVAVSVDGDGQMDPDDMVDLIEPIASGRADYAKGNRILDTRQWKEIPRTRLIGNAVLSLLTKIASGYWSVTDSQSGYSAAGRAALERIDWNSMYRRYGRPNDVLVLANVAECRVADVPVRAVYGVGERSSMKIAKVTVTITLLLIKRFWWRMFHKYALRDFHPLLFFYCLALLTAGISVALFIRLIASWISNGYVPQMTALALGFFAITCLNSLFFGFWMDMQANTHLAVKTSPDNAARPNGVDIG
jgi:glycosyltransferase involved in cell wall biosynthesis